MEITQLEFFIKVVEEGSFSKAAERVFRTQPAVSIAIKRLEDEVGAPLFDRSAKTPQLTEVGHVVYDYARRIITLRDGARAAIEELRTLRRGRVRIGANESTSLYLLPQIVLAFREQHPNVKVEISRQVSHSLPRRILDRDVDFALMASEPTDEKLNAFPVLKDDLILIFHPRHRLARSKSVKVAELADEDFLAHNVQTTSRLHVVETFAKHHTPLNITLELATIETIKRFVQQRIGIAFVPRMCVHEELERRTLLTIPVQGLKYTRTLWAAHLRDGELPPAAAAFLAILREQANAMKS